MSQSQTDPLFSLHAPNLSQLSSKRGLIVLSLSWVTI